MKTTKWIGKLFLASLIIFLVSCSGDDGETGPVGPQGEQGVAGSQGERGETGTANVIYSDWIPSGFEPLIANSHASFLINNVNELTDEVKSTGTIMVYGRYTDVYTHIEPLPKSIFGLRMQYYDFKFNDFNQNISIMISSIDGSDIGIPIYDDYRYIIIPGGVPSYGKSAVDYSKMDYKEFRRHFNIPE